MEKWQMITISDLKAFRQKEKSIKRLEERLSELNESCGKIQAVRYDSESHGNGQHLPEDNWINDIVLKREIEAQLRAVRCEVYHVRQTLEALEPEERKVLEGFFMNRTAGYIDKLISELNLERSSVYRLKDRALEHYVLIAYGVTSYH